MFSNFRFQISNFKASILFVCLVIAAGCAGEKAFKKGGEMAAKGDIDQAVIYYQKALTLESDNLSYRVELEKARTTSALKHFAKGEEYLKGKKYDAAEVEYQVALLMDSTLRKAEYAITRVHKLKESENYYNKGIEFLNAQKIVEAKTAFRKALSLDPKNEAAKVAYDKLKESKTKLDGYDLSLKSTKPITLKFKDTSIKEVFEIISKLSGINFIFDEDLKDHKISIFLQDATFEQAMELLLLTNKIFARVVTENTVIIIPKTPAKVKQYQDLVIHTFYLSHIEAKKAVNLLRALLQLKQIHVNEELNALIVRDEPDRIKLAQKIIEANDIPDAEVMLEVEIITVEKNKVGDLGLSLYMPTATGYSAGISTAAGISTSGTDFVSSLTYNDLKNLNINSNILFSPLPRAVFNFRKTQSGSQTLANPKIRVLNNGKARIHIGRRVPVVTTTITSTGQSQTSVQYQDVGTKLNVEPTIHIDDAVTIKLSLEVSDAGAPQEIGGTVTYTVTTTSAESVLKLRDGETQIIGGLISNAKGLQEDTTPLLGEIPVIGRLFTSKSKKESKSEVLLAITPHIVRGLEIPSEEITTIWSGKEDEFTVRAPFESFKEKEDEVSPPPSPGITPAPSAAPVPGRPGGLPKEVAPPIGPDAKGILPDESASIPAGKGTIYMIAPKGAKVDQEFTVTISLGEAANLYGASINVSYDPALVEFVRVAEGDLLKQDGKPTSFMHAVNAVDGRVTVGMTRLGGVGGVSGSGSLFSAVFKAKEEGAAPISFQDATLKDPALATIPSTPMGIEVKITK